MSILAVEASALDLGRDGGRHDVGDGLAPGGARPDGRRGDGERLELEELDPLRAPELPEFLVYRPRPPARRAYRIYRTDRGFRVVGSPPDGAELERALRAAGVRKGVQVEIGDEVLEWQ